MLELNNYMLERIRNFARIVSVSVSILGGLVLLGWSFDFETLKRISLTLVAMNPATAVAFILCGIALWSSLGNPENQNSQAIGASEFSFAKICASIVILIGALKLGELWFGWPAHIDQLLFYKKLDGPGNELPNRMAPNTALNFVLVGISLLLLDFQTRSNQRPAQYFALGSAFLSWLALMGYAYRSPLLYGIASYIPMALHTAIAFLLLSLAVLSARPDFGLMGIVTSRSSGGLIARRVLPAIFLIETALGWLRLSGVRKGLYLEETGVAIMVILSFILCSIVVLWSASSLNRAEAERQKIQLALDKSAAEIQDLYNNSPCGYHSVDTNGIFINVNDTELAWRGCSREELIGKVKHRDLVAPETKDAYEKGFAFFKEHGEVKDLEFKLLRKDGTTRDVLLNATAVKDASGQILYSRSTMFDITERKQNEEKIAKLNRDLQSRAAELEAANKELESFSYSVSHDLRAPLRHVAGFVDLLRSDLGKSISPKSNRFLDIIAGSTKQMGQLIDELLVFSKMGRVEMLKTNVNTNRLVDESIATLESEINGRNIIWEKANLPEVQADPAMLRQVFLNLASNAIKYTQPRDPARIQIGFEEKDQETIVFFRDNGVGFDMQFANKLFGVFQRLHHSDEFDGTGIGLANVRRIIQRHGGRTWAEGKVDEGATFYFSLPKLNNTTPET